MHITRRKDEEPHFNELTASEDELLACLFEEASEISQEACKIVQIVGKVMRHGYESVHPFQPVLGTNRNPLESEIGDFLTIVLRMGREGHIDIDKVYARAKLKDDLIKPYLHHN